MKNLLAVLMLLFASSASAGVVNVVEIYDRNVGDDIVATLDVFYDDLTNVVSSFEGTFTNGVTVFQLFLADLNFVSVNALGEVDFFSSSALNGTAYTVYTDVDAGGRYVYGSRGEVCGCDDFKQYIAAIDEPGTIGLLGASLLLFGVRRFKG